MVRNIPDGKLPCLTGSRLLVERRLQQSCIEVVVTGLPGGEPNSVCYSTPKKHILEEFRHDNDSWQHN